MTTNNQADASGGERAQEEPTCGSVYTGPLGGQVCNSPAGHAGVHRMLMPTMQITWSYSPRPAEPEPPKAEQDTNGENSRVDVALGAIDLVIHNMKVWAKHADNPADAARFQSNACALSRALAVLTPLASGPRKTGLSDVRHTTSGNGSSGPESPPKAEQEPMTLAGICPDCDGTSVSKVHGGKCRACVNGLTTYSPPKADTGTLEARIEQALNCLRDTGKGEQHCDLCGRMSYREGNNIQDGGIRVDSRHASSSRAPRRVLGRPTRSVEGSRHAHCRRARPMAWGAVS